MFKVYEKEVMKLNAIKDEYYNKKFELKIKQLELKYSDEYTQYKTIKEKEERAVLETQNLQQELFKIKNELRTQRLKTELEKMEIDYYANRRN